MYRMYRALITQGVLSNPKVKDNPEFIRNHVFEADTMSSLWDQILEYFNTDMAQLRRTIRRNGLYNKAGQCIGFVKQGWDYSMDGAFWRVDEVLFEQIIRQDQPIHLTPR